MTHAKQPRQQRAVLWLAAGGVVHKIGQSVDRALVVTTSVSAAAAVSGKSVFPAAFVRSRAYVAAAIARFIGLEVIEALRTALRKGAVVAVMGIEAIVHVSVKAGMAMEPGTRTDKDSAHKPVRAVVAVGSAVIGRVVEISVRAHRSDAYVDGNLGRAVRRTAHESKGKHWKCKELTRDHSVSFVSV
jgi:hypothetical protein